MAFRNDRVDTISNIGKVGSYCLQEYGRTLSESFYKDSFGMLRSSDFILQGAGFISFLMAGGINRGTSFVSIKESGTNLELYRVSSPNTTTFTLTGNRVKIDLSAHLDKTLYILVVQNAGGLARSNFTLDDFITYYPAETIFSEVTGTSQTNQIPVIYNAGSASIGLNTLAGNVTN